MIFVSNSAAHGWISRLVLRAGYNTSGNPIRAEDVTFNILAPGVVRHHVTAGGTWALGLANASERAWQAMKRDAEVRDEVVQTHGKAAKEFEEQQNRLA